MQKSSLNILHLSDLHLRRDGADALAAKIFNASKGTSSPVLVPKVILVTGDIFDGPLFASGDYREAIENAVAFFTSLTSSFDIEDFSKQLFFVPGNHEIHRQSIKDGKSEERFNRYREFLAEIYAEKWDGLVGSIYDEEHLCYVKHFDEENLILVGLVSPHYEKSKKKDATKDELIETALIGDTQIRTMHQKIMGITKAFARK